MSKFTGRNVTIKLGAKYDLREREHQVLLMVDMEKPIIFSHDKSLISALVNCVQYLENEEA